MCAEASEAREDGQAVGDAAVAVLQRHHEEGLHRMEQVERAVRARRRRAHAWAERECGARRGW